MPSSLALEPSSGSVTMSLAANSRALTTTKQIFSGDMERPANVISPLVFLFMAHLDLTLDPVVSQLLVGLLYRGPGDPVRGLFLPRIARVSRKGMIERLPVDVLCMRRQASLNRGIGHLLSRGRSPPNPAPDDAAQPTRRERTVISAAKPNRFH